MSFFLLTMSKDSEFQGTFITPVRANLGRFCRLGLGNGTNVYATSCRMNIWLITELWLLHNRRNFNPREHLITPT